MRRRDGEGGGGALTAGSHDGHLVICGATADQGEEATTAGHASRCEAEPSHGQVVVSEGGHLQEEEGGTGR